MGNEQTAPGFDDEMREIFDSYLIEAREILDHLSQDLLALEKAPSENRRGTGRKSCIGYCFRNEADC